MVGRSISLCTYGAINMRNFNILLRSILSFGLIALLMIGMGGGAVSSLKELKLSMDDLQDNSMASIILADKINQTILKILLENRRLIAEKDNFKKEVISANLKRFQDESSKQFQDYMPFIASDDEQKIFNAAFESSQILRPMLERVATYVKNGEIDQALELVRTNNEQIGVMQGNVAKLAELNVVEAGQAKTDAAITYERARDVTVLIVIIATILTVVLAVFFTRSIVKPLNSVISVNQKISEGDLRQDILVTGNDELTTLMRSTYTMQKNLRDTIMEISDSSAQLASAAEEMTTVTDNSSRGLVFQNDEVNQAATAVTEMSAAVDEVARNAESASEESKRTQGFAEVGLNRVAQTLSSIQKLSGNVENTSDQIQGLSQRAQTITKVVEVIRAIAEQTNLLALNAAIEAARAGEQGRGFAVVADEVRALAHRTQQSTQEIEQMIALVQSDSEQAVAAMTTSKALASESLDVAREASSSLDKIASAITQINERNLLIATASEEQAHVAREVDRNLVSIRELAAQSSSGASQTASACAELSKLAVSLNKLVSRFAV